jgi:hypothetical protein
MDAPCILKVVDHQEWLLITDNLQSTTGCPTVVEFRQGLHLDRDLDVEEQNDNPDKRFT